MSDWRKFLGKKESIVLAYLGGARVRGKEREVRVVDPPEKEGWYQFEIEGRTATVIAEADADFNGLPKIRGHVVGDVLFVAGAKPERVSIMPDDEPEMFALCTCFRWHDGQLIFGELELEGESEGAVRTAFEERRTLSQERGVAAALRAAFAFAVARRVARAKGTTCSPREVWPRANEIADGGDAAAEVWIEALEERRRGQRVEVAGATVRVQRIVEAAARHIGEATLANVEERVHAALRAAGGHVHAIRKIDGGRHVEVHFMFDGERFVTLAEALTLQVIDAGICLVDHHDGHRGDRELTLESLPAVIREAVELGALAITRR